mgnify:CR=1 FL=1
MEFGDFLGALNRLEVDWLDMEGLRVTPACHTGGKGQVRALGRATYARVRAQRRLPDLHRADIGIGLRVEYFDDEAVLIRVL